MVRTYSTPLKSAREIVLKRAKTYAYKGRYLQVYVFTTWVSELRMLTYVYGGHYYRHGSGWRWVLAKRGSLIALVKDLTDDFPSTNQFEKPILEYYVDKN